MAYRSNKVELPKDGRSVQEQAGILQLSQRRELSPSVQQPFDTFKTQVNTLQDSVSRSEKRLTIIESKFKSIEDRFARFEANIESRFNDLEHRLPGSDESIINVRQDQLDLAEVLSSAFNDKLSVKDAIRVLPLAHRQGITSCVTNLSMVLLNGITSANCVKIFHFAFQYKLDKVLEASKNIIMSHFYKVCDNDRHVCQLSLEELKFFVYSDFIRARESHVVRVISRWVVNDQENRRDFIGQLLPAIRLERCDLSFLTDLEHHFLTKREPTFLENVRQNMERLSLTDDDQWSSKWRSADIMIVMGGWNSNGVIETFHTTTNNWIKHNIPDAPDRGTWIGSLDHLILVIEEDNKRFRSFDTRTQVWQDLKELPVYREYVCCAQDRHLIYVMGGKGYGTRCDRYDIETDEWTVVTNMRYSRTRASAASLHGPIYCCGGRKEPGNETLSSVEMYDTEDNTWYEVSPMEVARSEFSLVSCGRFLWAVGGWRNANRASALERYSPVTKMWTRLPDMPTGINAPAACFNRGLLYVTGGLIDETVKYTGVYDPVTETWTRSTDLIQERFSHGSCVIKAEPHVYDEPIN